MKIKNYLKENKYLLILFCVVLIGIFNSYFLKPNSFKLGYDFQSQHLFFYSDFKRLISSHQFPFYSLNLFLGNNFFASKSYYLLGDPFSYITLLFSLNDLIGAMFLIYILKFLCAFLLFNHLLYLFGLDSKQRIMPALAYSFCGWAMLFLEHPMFITWYSFLPLIFIGIEKVLHEKKYFIFVIATALILVSNYYFFFTTSVFLTFYWTIRYFQIKKIDFKLYFKDTLKLIIYYFVGVLIPLFLIIPSFIHLINNPRISTDFVLTKKWVPIKIYFDLILKSFIGPFKVNDISQLLFNTNDYNTNNLTIYSSVLSLILLPQVFCLKNKKLRNGFLILLAIEFLILVSPYGASLMHGFKVANFRWTLLLIVTIIIVVAHVIKQDFINKKVLVATTLFYLIMLFVLLWAANYYHKPLWDHLKPEYHAIYVSIVLLIVYFLILFFKFKYFKILLVIIFGLEIISYGNLTLKRYPNENFDYNFDKLLPKEAIDYVKKIEGENSFYRIYVPYHHYNFWMPHNVNLYYDFKSAYTYDSLSNPYSQNYAREFLGGYDQQLQFDIKNPKILKQLYFKYYLVKKEKFNLGKKDYNKQTFDLNAHKEFELVKDFGEFKLYRDKSVDNYPLVFSLLKDNIMHARSNMNGVINTTIAYDKGFEVYVNNKRVKGDEMPYFLSFKANKGDEIIIKYHPKGLFVGLFFTICGSIILLIVYFKERKCR